METAHLLRKYNPAEWGGTETAVKQLVDGLAELKVKSAIYAPTLPKAPETDPFAAAGHSIKRYRAFLPVAGLSPDARKQMIAVGGNIMSFELFHRLLFHRKLEVIHSHALNRIGGIGLTVAKARKVPFLLTIHGGVLALPQSVKDGFTKPLEKAFEWGKVFGPFIRSRKVLEEADAILTCNKLEAELLQKKYPDRRVIVHPHGVPVARYYQDHRAAALNAFPEIQGRKLCLVVGRIDPVKNQGWVLEQAPSILAKHPNALFMFVGAVTDELYAKAIRKEIKRLGLEDKVLMPGGLPPGAPELKGLIQSAKVLIVPSLSETFGLVILEAWAANTPVISTKNSGAVDLIREGENGCLFDLNDPATFAQAVDKMLSHCAWAEQLARNGHELALRDYDTLRLAERVKKLYAELIELKHR